MKMISKIANVALGLVFVGSSVFAQSLDDAKKAIDAEQYQKAKSMLKNLTATQATKDENFFYLGWVYLIQEYPDSAKEQFTKGLAVNPKSALSYAGLGAVAHFNKDASGASTNFTQAATLASKKDTKVYVYIAKGYLLLPPGVKAVSAEDAATAVGVLNKGVAANPKDPELFIELGNVASSQKNATEAYNNFSTALTLDPKSLTANVAEGVLWENAQNFEDAEKQFKVAIAIDPNFGPAYNEWAETDLYWAQTNKAVAADKYKEALEHYQKFLSLTDNSTESLMRYADFLYNAHEYKTLQDVANTLSKSANSNARVYRYIGYAASENKDYAAGLAAMNNWFAKAGPSRIIPTDYLVLGHLQIASGQDTAKGVVSLEKAADLDTIKAESIYSEIATMYRAKRKYLEAAKAYEDEINKVHGKLLLQDHFYLGFSYYFAFLGQSAATKTNPAIKPDSTLLTKADSALSYTQQKAATQLYFYPQYRGLIANERDADYSHFKGLAKPFYDQIITLLGTKSPLSDGEKRALGTAYGYEGNYYVYKEKDDAKALDYFTKARDTDPNNAQAKFYFDQKATPAKK
jgi:Flp pilus assembly protein TadD